MDLLKEKIVKEGQVYPGNILKVDCFLNHQIDCTFLREVGKEFHRLFKDEGVNKILTIEASGIAIGTVVAQEFKCPLVFAKKNKTKNIAGNVYSSSVESFTHSTTYNIIVSEKFLNPGDKVLVPNPGYPTYTSLSRILGCEVVCYDLLEDHGWQPDFATLESMDMTGVKIMWVNYPNMPTGAPASKEVYQRIVNLARNKGILVVNDNPYSFILSHQHLSILQIPGSKDCCLEFNSMSKSHNMPGWRVGLVAGRADYISWILKVKSNIDSGMFRPLQLAAAEAYSNDEAWHEEANIQVYARRRQIAGRIMEALGCRYDPSQVGMFLWGRIPDCYAQVEDLTEWVLHKARVFITPGFIFGSNGKRFLRISLCAGEEKMEEALQRIQQALSKDNSHYQQ